MAIVGKVVGSLGLGLAAIVGYGVYLEWNVHRWDRKIDALCAANGGRDVAVRVYETVMAPETDAYFHANRSLKLFRVPSVEAGTSSRSDTPYVVEVQVLEVLNEQDPYVIRYVERIRRLEDRKTLGERTRYMRSGGGVPSPDPSTPYHCPNLALADGLAINVFLNHPRRTEAGLK